jgi:hypothetical protein
MAQPVESKVKASTSAAAVSGLILWVLGQYVFKGGIPDAFVSWIYAIVPGVLAFAAGYIARHTPRDLPVVEPPTTTEAKATVVPAQSVMYQSPTAPAPITQ